MKPSHSTALRLALVILLASALLAVLPTALLAQQTDGTAARPDPIIQSAARVNNPHVPLTLTFALRTKLHPTLVKQLLTPTDDQLPVIIQLHAQPNLNQPAITSAATALDRRTALVHELQTTAARRRPRYWHYSRGAAGQSGE